MERQVDAKSSCPSEDEKGLRHDINICPQSATSSVSSIMVFHSANIIGQRNINILNIGREIILSEVVLHFAEKGAETRNTTRHWRETFTSYETTRRLKARFPNIVSV